MNLTTRLFLSIQIAMLFSTSINHLYGQSEAGEIRKKEINRALQQFGQSETRLLNALGGELYTNTVPQAKGSPYFPSPQWIAGTLITKNHQFENVLLKYDAYQDQLLYLNKDGSQAPISLNPSYIEGFEILSKPYRYFPKDKNLPFSGFAGFYPFKKFNFYEKTYSKLEKGSDNPFGQHNIKQQYYLQVDGAYFLIKNNKHLYEAFPDKMEELKTYIKKNKLSIRRLETSEFLRLLSYYDSL